MARVVDVAALDLGRAGRYINQQRDAHAALMASSQDVAHLGSELQRGESEIERLQLVGTPVPEHWRLEQERHKAAVTLARARHDELTRGSAGLGALVGALKDFLKLRQIDLRGVPPTVAQRTSDGPGPTVDDVAALRSRVAELKAERKRVLTAPWSRREAFAKIGATLDRYESAAGVSAAPFLSRTAEFRLVPDVSLGVDGINIVELRDVVRRLEGQVVRFARPQLEAALEEGADAEAAKRGGWGLSEADRQARLSAIDDEIFAVECAEAAALEDLEARGIRIERRSDIDVYALLLRTDAMPPVPERAEPTPASARQTAAAEPPRRRMTRSKYLESGRVG